MAQIPDERLPAGGARRRTEGDPATIRVVDVPGTGPQLLGNLRQVDALLAVADGFSPGADPAADLETSRSSCSSPTATTSSGGSSGSRSRRSRRDAALRREVDELRDAARSPRRRRRAPRLPAALPGELDPLTTMPTVELVNGPGGIDLKLEAELAELPDEEAAAFRDGPSALDEVVRRLTESLDLITFFTAGEKETRAWTLRRGQTALDAADSIHSDIARGFIRARSCAGTSCSRPARTPRRRGAAAAARGQDLRRRGRRRASTSASTSRAGAQRWSRSAVGDPAATAPRQSQNAPAAPCAGALTPRRRGTCARASTTRASTTVATG